MPTPRKSKTSTSASKKTGFRFTFSRESILTGVLIAVLSVSLYQTYALVALASTGGGVSIVSSELTTSLDSLPKQVGGC